MTVSTAEISSNDLNNGAAFLEFAAAPAALPAIAAPPAKNERLVAAKRQRLYAHGYTLGVVLLILASGAECVYRLAWAMQP